MIPLHSHSYYSLLKGTIPYKKIVDLNKSYGARAAALTDDNGMYGLIQFAQYALEENIKPILGSYIDDPANEKLNAVFIARNNAGYSELCKLITTRRLDDSFSLLNVINNDISNFFVLTSSLSLLEKLNINEALRKSLFVEMIDVESRERINRALHDFAKSNSLRICASHPAYFLNKEDFLLHKVMSAIRTNTTLENLEDNLLVDEEFYYRNPVELENRWASMPEAVQNAEYIEKNCNVDLNFGKYKFPDFPLPPDETAYSLLWKICFKGLESRYSSITDDIIKRLQYELEVIDELGFCDYFLVVWDIVREARSREMVTIGRGSAANSLVSYCLGLTQVDPIEHNLYFERFLNRGRTSPPDVDLDFSWKERDEIVKYVFEKYGYDKVAMISTTVTFRARSAFRETAKVFGVPDGEISKFSKFIPWTSAHNLPVLAQKFPEAKSLKFDSEPWKSVIEIASKLSSFPRHLSIHPGGIVITSEPITNYVALEYAKNKGVGIIITQPDMYPIEDLGLIKIDLLSQRSLGVLRDTLTRLNDSSKPGAGGGSIFKLKD